MIDVSGLRKRFGPTVALDGMTFTVAPGTVTGFVGPNGAGKSTTIRVILGLDAPDEGHALIGGKPYARLPHPLHHVGALVDAAALQPGRTGRNHLLWLAHSQGMSAGHVDTAIELVGLGRAARRKAGGYSLGMRQRLGIAAAMLGDPPVIIMDEPFNGMDPEGIIWMRGLLRSLAAEGRAVLVSSHLMGELQGIADHVVVVGRGRVLANARVEDLVARASDDQVRLRTSAPDDAAAVLHRAGTAATVADAYTVTVSGTPAQRVVEVLGRAGVPFSEVTAHRATLEEVYLRLTGGEAEYQAGTPHQEARR
ncbi:ATP-binding cassette domain-containing protein [Actinomadura sp. LCR2-06]|uniref:ATP-binding cassette domain-containing protein n=2 Tax=Actinomadura violacea TaxID=2819934 RepID=A0ABS3RJB8_9ACTN|nr:ATP-binding cassette domain-containing protein [Actinomadura violacea]MBO2456840.1 ATP-binding cassette domain-containing protein [Actinomadura violacea]